MSNNFGSMESALYGNENLLITKNVHQINLNENGGYYEADYEIIED